MRKAKQKSRPWMQQHVNDVYVKESVAQGYRSRAAFKLLQIQEQERVLSKGMTVIDVGAAPGSWSQVATGIVGPHGTVIAIDCLPMDPIPGVDIVQGDFLEIQIVNEIKTFIRHPVDLILSDIAPNLTGQSVTDQACALRLWQAVLTFSEHVLKKDGVLVIKVFQGPAVDAFRRTLAQWFKMIKVRKPAASRSHSKEFYLVAKQFNG